MSKVHTLESKLHRSVAVLRGAAEGQNVFGFVFPVDTETAWSLTGVKLAAHVRELADHVGRIQDSIHVEDTIEKVEALLEDYYKLNLFTPTALEEARVAWRQERLMHRDRPPLFAKAA